MAHELTYRLTTTRFDEDYSPSTESRLTTNFANLARGEHRRENLRTALALIDHRLNDLVSRGDRVDGGDGGDGVGRHQDRYSVELDIVSATLHFTAGGDACAFPLLEMLQTWVVDRSTGERHHGLLGNNFSSYVRDFDFSVLLPAARGASGSEVPEDFGELHGKLFEHFLGSAAYRERFRASPVICLSVSTSRTYRRTERRHPVLGVEYQQDEPSLTDVYFQKMGMSARCFMPPGGVAPLAFYFRGDLLADHGDLQLAATVAVMETFQKIYRPEIYGARAAAGAVYRPSLAHQDYARTPVAYDRVERSQLAVTQGKYAEEHLMKPHGRVVERWAAQQPSPVR